MYCIECAKNQIPRIGNLALLYGSSSERFYVLNIKTDNQISEYGFTPHLICCPIIRTIEKEQFVIFDYVCCINGCGIDLIFNPHNNLYEYSFEVVKKQFYPIERFIGLMNHKYPEYYVQP